MTSDKIIGVRAQSTLGGHQIFARKICIKNQQKMAEFYMILARKMPEFYVILPEKYLCPNFRGHVPPPLPPSPMPMDKILDGGLKEFCTLCLFFGSNDFILTGFC